LYLRIGVRVRAEYMLCQWFSSYFTREFFFTQVEFCTNLATSWLYFHFTIANNSGSNLTFTKLSLLNLLCISIVSRRFLANQPL